MGAAQGEAEPGVGDGGPSTGTSRESAGEGPGTNGPSAAGDRGPSTGLAGEA